MLSYSKRRINGPQLEAAGRALLGAVVAGSSWDGPLEELMPSLGAFGGGLARVKPPNLFGLPTCGVADVVEAIAKHRTPPLTKLTRVDPAPKDGFVCDQMDAYRLARARDPFCQEFLRPRGLTYQASAFVDLTPGGAINFMLFRGPNSDGFDSAELETFSCLLPYVRAATMASRSMLRIDAERAAAPFRSRGDPAIHVAQDGTVLDGPQDALDLLNPDIRLLGGRLAASSPSDQKRIDRALTCALTGRRPALITIATELLDAVKLLFIPILGQALDVFRATAALVIVLDVSNAAKVSEEGLDLVARSAGLTRRETDVAQLIASGQTPREAAIQLQIGYETARLHLKAVFSKVGVHGQAELAALLQRLSRH